LYIIHHALRLTRAGMHSLTGEGDWGGEGPCGRDATRNDLLQAALSEGEAAQASIQGKLYLLSFPARPPPSLPPFCFFCGSDAARASRTNANSRQALFIYPQPHATRARSRPPRHRAKKQVFLSFPSKRISFMFPYKNAHTKQVSEDLRRLKWCFLPTRNLMQRARDPVRPATKQVFLTEVQDIRMGMRTANFKRLESTFFGPSLPPSSSLFQTNEKNSNKGEKFRGGQTAAFSIITQERTIDILCPSPEVMDQWVMGLRFLVDRLRPLPPSLPPSLDKWMILARLRRGGFLLKFGQIGRPHERYVPCFPPSLPPSLSPLSPSCGAEMTSHR